MTQELGDTWGASQTLGAQSAGGGHGGYSEGFPSPQELLRLRILGSPVLWGGTTFEVAQCMNAFGLRPDHLLSALWPLLTSPQASSPA